METTITNLTDLGFKHTVTVDPQSYFEFTEIAVYTQDDRKILSYTYSALGYMGHTTDD